MREPSQNDVIDIICEADILGWYRVRFGKDGFGQLSIEIKGQGQGLSTPCISDMRGKYCCICGRGWDNNPFSMMDQYIESNGSDKSKFMHMTCKKGVVAYNQRLRFTEALLMSRKRVPYEHGVKWENLKEIPNEYGGGWNMPWYEAEFTNYPGVKVKFGCRKNVDHVEVIGIGSSDIFAKIEATNGATDHGAYAHAWTDAEVNARVAEIAVWLSQNRQPLEKT